MLLEQSTLILLGANPTCSLRNGLPTELEITLGLGATITQGLGQFFFNSENFYANPIDPANANIQPNYERLPLDINLEVNPDVDATPTAVIVAPNEHSVVCGDLTLYGTSSTGSLGRPLLYSWRLTRSGIEINTNLQEYDSANSIITITSGLSGSDSNLEIELTV